MAKKEKSRINWLKVQTLAIILQTFAVVITLPLIFWQVSSDLDLRRKAQTMEHIATMLYQAERDIKICGVDEAGNILYLTPERAQFVSTDPELKSEIQRLLAEFEFYATGVNQNVFDFDVANRLNGGYTIEQYKRYYAYIQLVIDAKPDLSYKSRIYDQLERLVFRLNETRLPPQDLPILNRTG